MSLGITIALLLGAAPVALGRGVTPSTLGAEPAASPNLVGKPLIAVTPSTFWSVNIKTNNSSGIWTDGALKRYVNETPFTWFQYGTWTDQCNISANLQYENNGSRSIPCAWNMTAFKQWCFSLVPRCGGIFPLPGENNDSAEDAYIANWLVKTVGYQPDYFNIGNEPDLWHHYGIPWAKWSPSDHSTPTPLAFAIEVRNVIAAVRAVDPTAKFIGIEATGAYDTSWFQQVVQLNGANLSAIAYHSYPSAGVHNVTLPQFLGPLEGRGNISTQYADVRADILGRCASCSTLPIFLQEYNAGPGWAPSTLNGTYANALFLAASTVQALRANVSMFTIFSLENNGTFYNYSLLNRTDTVGPTGVLFNHLLNHVATGTVYDLAPRSKVRNVWEVLTENATTASVLVANANLSHSVQFRLGPLIRHGGSETIYNWSPAIATPSVRKAPFSGNLTVPPEGIVLVDVPIARISAPAPPGTRAPPVEVGSGRGFASVTNSARSAPATAYAAPVGTSTGLAWRGRSNGRPRLATVARPESASPGRWQGARGSRARR